MSLDLVCVVLAVVVALSRGVSFAAPLWNKLAAVVPAKFHALVPVAVAMLPLVLSLAGIGSSALGLVHSLVVGGALLAPGMKNAA